MPFGSTVRKTKDGVNLVSKVMAGKVTKTALKGQPFLPLLLLAKELLMMDAYRHLKS